MTIQPHAETGRARARARQSLFDLLVITVFLAALVNGLVNHLGAEVRGLRWTVILALLLAGMVILLVVGLRRDDQRIGVHRTQIELFLPYRVWYRTKQVRLGLRDSYRITGMANHAWASRFSDRPLSLAERKGTFPGMIMPEHFALLRHLLVMLLCEYGQFQRGDDILYQRLRLDMPLETADWQAVPALIRENPFSQAVGDAGPPKRELLLPPGLAVQAFDSGDLLLCLTYCPTKGSLCALLRLLHHPPEGEVRVRWVWPLVEPPRDSRINEHLTVRLPPPPDDANEQLHVLLTRLEVEVETRWNILEDVAHFRDWGMNLAQHLWRRMDYWCWRQDYLERMIDSLDWKLGWVEKKPMLGIAGLLKRMNERLARLEAHLWPDEPPQGGSEGAWLEGPEDTI